MTFYEILSAAVADLQQHGFDSVERVDVWVERLRAAARAQAASAGAAETMVEDGLAAIYRKLVERGGVSRFNPGVQKFTLERVKPKLRAELDRRIMASAQLIKRNREEAIEKTLHRFQGWATSIPVGGSDAGDRRELKKDFGKPLRALDYEERRVRIDQGHKLTASISEILARDTNAIAAQWRSNWRQHGYNYRQDHKERDGKVYLLRGNWAQEKGFVKPGPAGYYEDITSAGEEVFCFPGDSEVPFADGVEVAYRRFYAGELVTFNLASGTRVRATPNHPILTSNGWVAAGALDETCYVVEIADEVHRLAEKYKNHTRVPVIQDIFGALQENGVINTLGLATTDFHGDGVEGEVDVVFAARPLAFGFATVANIEPIHNFLFAKTDHTRASLSNLMRRGFASFCAAPSTVRRFNQRIASVSVCLCHASKHTFAKITNRAPALFHMTFDYLTRYSVFGGQRLDAATLLVRCPDDASVKKDFAFGNRLGTDIKPCGLNPAPKSPLIDADDGRDLRDRLPFATKLSHVVKIDRRSFSGHVYNLQTESDWYVTQNVVTHNCRCTVRWLYNLRGLPDDVLTEKGRAALTEARQKAAGLRIAAPAAKDVTVQQRVAANARTKDPDERVVMVDVRKVDRAWAETPDYRIRPHAPGENYKLDRAKTFIQQLQSDAPFDAPKLGVSDRSFGFDDGRHRFAAMRDLGFTEAPVAMDPRSVEHARRRGWLVER